MEKLCLDTAVLGKGAIVFGTQRFTADRIVLRWLWLHCLSGHAPADHRGIAVWRDGDDAAAAAAPPATFEPVAQAEILEAELSPLDAVDGEPIEDAFVELLEE